MTCHRMAEVLDPFWLDLLRCPVDGGPLTYGRGELLSASGRRYPVVDGVPVLLVEEADATIDTARASLALARGEQEDRLAPGLYLESVGVTDAEREATASLPRDGAVDPVVSCLVGATNGIAYNAHRRRLQRLPIPRLRLPPGGGRRFLDLGSGWGRWCFAAARAGYRPVGIEPSLGAVLAARRTAARLGLEARFLVGDARWLPFAPASFDTVFSYSVLQHLAEADFRRVLEGVGRAVRPGGEVLIQLANRWGVRSLWHQLRARGREPGVFDVRYRRPRHLLVAFEAAVGPARLEADCWFGLGLQPSDADLLTPAARAALTVSEGLRAAARVVPPLVRSADSVYVRAVRRG